MAAGTASPSAQTQERRRGGSTLTTPRPRHPAMGMGSLRLRPARTQAGATASAGAQADSQAPGAVPRASPPAFEPAGLQAPNSQLQARLSVPRKQRRVLSFTLLEGRSCQRPRLPHQLLGAGSRWRDGTPDSEQTFQGRRGRKTLHTAWPAVRRWSKSTHSSLSSPPPQATRRDFHTRVDLDRCH